jgi:hypothetical protein
MLLAEVTRAWEAAADVKAAHITAMLAVETSVWEASVAWDSATLRVKDAEDRPTLAEREELERMSRVEAVNVTVLACAHEDVEGLIGKITLLEGNLVVEL